jgi:hypothetical protein
MSRKRTSGSWAMHSITRAMEVTRQLDGDGCFESEATFVLLYFVLKSRRDTSPTRP